MRALVFSIDDPYVMPFRVLFHSLHKTGSIPGGTPIFVIHEGELSEASISDLRVFVEAYKYRVFFVNASGNIPDDLPVSDADHVSRATFYRLFVASILPPNITSAVYLDSDAIVLRSIRQLFEIKCSSPLAAVDHMSPQNVLRLWGDKGGDYFQAGVLLLDLHYWRNHRCEDAFTEIIRQHRTRLHWWDQDILNIAFENNWQRLDVWFNVCQSLMTSLPVKEIDAKAKLIHYDGSHKPWKRNVQRPFKDLWLNAYEQAFGERYELPRLHQAKPGLVNATMTYLKKFICTR